MPHSFPNRRFARICVDRFFSLSVQPGFYLRFFFALWFLASFSALSVPAQTISFSEMAALAGSLERGSPEQKRDALARIRNLKSAQASLLAVSALKDQAEIVRATAAQAVIFLPKEEALLALIPLFSDKSEFVRRETAYALGELSYPKAAGPLARQMLADKKRSVRDAAAVALGRVGDAESAQILAVLLSRSNKKQDEFLRRAAARSIGQIASRLNRTAANNAALLSSDGSTTETSDLSPVPAAFPALRAASSVLLRILRNPQETSDVKREAALALGEIGDPRAVPVLQSLLAAEDEFVARTAGTALGKIRNRLPGHR